MFVRTKKGRIYDCVVGEQMGKPIYYPKTSKTNGYIDWNEVYKKSENIIDILEVGDYVNGEKVTSIIPPDILGDEELDHAHISSLNGEPLYEYIEIKSIVTKEQFESMSYKVGD